MAESYSYKLQLKITCKKEKWTEFVRLIDVSTPFLSIIFKIKNVFFITLTLKLGPNFLKFQNF